MRLRWGRSASRLWALCRPCRSGYTAPGQPTVWSTSVCLYTPLFYLLLIYGESADA